MMEAVVRGALRAHLLTNLAGAKGIVDELWVPVSNERADVAVIGRGMDGFEIKTERDTLKRLPRQMVAYGRLFDRCTAVVAERHREHAEDVLPDWWGLTTVHINGGVAFNTVRSPDRGLLALLEDGRWDEPDSLSELEADADKVFADFMRVMQARARLDSALASLGGDEFGMWETITDVTKFQPLVDGVDLKVKVLQDQSERRVQQAAARRERRTSSILSGLTALTIVTVAVALIGNFLGSRSDKVGHIGLRAAIVAVALLLAVAVYREAFREHSRLRTKRRPPSRNHA